MTGEERSLRIDKRFNSTDVLSYKIDNIINKRNINVFRVDRLKYISMEHDDEIGLSVPQQIF